MFIVYFAVKVSVIRVLINHSRSPITVKVSKKHISNINVKVILKEEKKRHFTTVPKPPGNVAPLNAHQLVGSVRRLVIGQFLFFLPEVPDEPSENGKHCICDT